MDWYFEEKTTSHSIECFPAEMANKWISMCNQMIPNKMHTHSKNANKIWCTNTIHAILRDTNTYSNSDGILFTVGSLCTVHIHTSHDSYLTMMVKNLAILTNAVNTHKCSHMAKKISVPFTTKPRGICALVSPPLHFSNWFSSSL